jgi:transposase
LFTYLTRPGVDATNWRAEQAVRPAVVDRKVWGGNRTRRGAGTQGRIMSALRTADQQEVDPIEFLVRLARAPDPATVSLFRRNSAAPPWSLTDSEPDATRYPSTLVLRERPADIGSDGA